MKLHMGKIRELVGNLSKEQLRNVDCFIGEDVGLFLPVGGACFYALTPRHTHPSYLFVLPFDDRTAIRIGGDEIVVKPEKLFALSPGIEHQEVPSEGPPRYIAVFIIKEFFNEQLRIPVLLLFQEIRGISLKVQGVLRKAAFLKKKIGS